MRCFATLSMTAMGALLSCLARDASCMMEASFKARVVENFSRSASTYDCHAEEQRAGAATLAKCAAECADNLGEGPVLEIGCGTGFFERVLSRTLPRATLGVDRSCASHGRSLSAKNGR